MNYSPFFFQLDPKSVWLRGADNQLYFPVNDKFSFPVSVGTVDVEGTTASETPVSTPTPVVLSGTPSSQSPQQCASSSRSKKFLVKIVKATCKVATNKPEFTPIEVGYVEITSATANVTYINQCIQDKWGDGYCIVSNDGLPIVDGAGTRG